MVAGTFGAHLREARRARGFTQRQLAIVVAQGDDRTVSDWECDVSLPRLRTAALIAATLGISLDDLVRDVAW